MRLAILTSHPIQYQAPLFQRLAGSLNLMVFFCNRHGVSPSFDQGFNRVVQFDVSLLDGYPHQFLSNLAPRPGPSPLGMINPGVVRLASQFDAVLVHGYTSITSILALASPKRRAAILFRGESNLLPHRSRMKQLAKTAVLKPLFGHIDHFMAIGSLNRDYYLSFGVPDERITVAPYSVDNAYFATRSSEARSNRAAARAQLGIPSDGPLFLFAAKLIAKKRPFDAIRAFVDASAAGPAHLALVGDGELMPAVRKQIDESGLSQRIHVLGFRNQSELPAIYGASDVLVLPSDLEPWGLVVNEAMACGAIPVVSDQVGSGPDLADPELIFPATNVARLTAILKSFIEDPSTLEAARRRSAVRIARWTLQHTSDAIVGTVAAMHERQVPMRHVGTHRNA